MRDLSDLSDLYNAQHVILSLEIIELYSTRAVKNNFSISNK